MGGEGGTGKSQVIKALEFAYESLKIKDTLRLCAYTGTAASSIGGSTLSLLVQLSHGSERRVNLKKLEATWAEVTTLCVDEVSMLGCRMLARMHKHIVLAKHSEDRSLPFEGIDVYFTGTTIIFLTNSLLLSV